MVLGGYGSSDIAIFEPLATITSIESYIEPGIYVVNSGSDTISVVPWRTEKTEKKEQFNIRVGDQPQSLAFASGVIYVTNTGSGSVSVINGFSGRLAAGIKFNIHPANSGTIVCDQKNILQMFIYMSTLGQNV